MSTLPTWLSAAASVFALVLSAAGVMFNRRSSQLQARQIDNLEQQNAERVSAERRELASKVAVWASIGTEEESPTIRLVNSSSLPVYELTVFVTTPFGSFETSYNVHGPRLQQAPMGGPTAQLRRALEGQDAHATVREGRVAVACAFRDAGGLWWSRTATGELREASDGSTARHVARPMVG